MIRHLWLFGSKGQPLHKHLPWHEQKYDLRHRRGYTSNQTNNVLSPIHLNSFARRERAPVFTEPTKEVPALELSSASIRSTMPNLYTWCMLLEVGVEKFIEVKHHSCAMHRVWAHP
jgi:hypothetical protein